MNFNGIQPSKRYVDHSNMINAPAPRQNWSNNSLTGALPPAIPQKDLSPFELMLAQHLGFQPYDIMLMRATGAKPDQIMQGWNLYPNGGQIGPNAGNR